MLQFETVTPLDIGNDDIEICGSFEAYPPESDFIWPGFMAGTVGALVAPGATGKSFWALEAAMSIACSVAGGDLMGLHPERSGRVRYLPGKTRGLSSFAGCISSANISVPSPARPSPKTCRLAQLWAGG